MAFHYDLELDTGYFAGLGWMALTGKQALFVEAYLRCWNKTESARQAGYAGNDATLGAIGYENFKNLKFSRRSTAHQRDGHEC